MIDSFKELRKFLDGEDLSIAEQALAHYQAEQITFDLHDVVFKYSSFESRMPVEIGQALTRDPRPYEKHGLVVSPLRLKPATSEDQIEGFVIKLNTTKIYKDENGNPYQEFSGLYLFNQANKSKPSTNKVP